MEEKPRETDGTRETREASRSLDAEGLYHILFGGWPGVWYS
jgi:hypothetical protein